MSPTQRKLYRLLPRWLILFRNRKISDITNTLFCNNVGAAQGLCVRCSSLKEYWYFLAVNKVLLELLHCCRKTTPLGKSDTAKSAILSINSITAKNFCQKSCDTECPFFKPCQMPLCLQKSTAGRGEICWDSTLCVCAGDTTPVHHQAMIIRAVHVRAELWPFRSHSLFSPQMRSLLIPGNAG